MLILGNDEFLFDELWNDIRVLDPSRPDEINAQIIRLSAALRTETEANPFFYMFLAYCYTLLADFGQAITCTTRAILGFRTNLTAFNDDINDQNRAFSCWYLGLLYLNNSDLASAYNYLERVDSIFIGLEKKFRQIKGIDKYNEIKKLRTALRTWIELTLKETLSYPRNQKPDPLIENRLNTVPNQPGKSDTKPEVITTAKATPTVSSNSVSSLHVTVLVDIDLNNAGQPLPTPAPQPVYKKLKDLNPPDGLSAPADEPTPPFETSSEVLQPYEIIIPSFPIYGMVTAGPKGEPYLEDSQRETADPVSETRQIIFDKVKYLVDFVSKSPIKFVNGKKYGWFKVSGQSMNNARRNPINHGDYVLFCENLDPEYCNNKIVVAFLPDENDKLFVLKRLRKFSTDTPNTDDGYSSEVIFELLSESTLEFDPETGKSYKEKIEIKNEHQLVGEVVVIAKPIP